MLLRHLILRISIIMLANLFGKVEYKQFKTKLHLFQIYCIKHIHPNGENNMSNCSMPIRDCRPRIKTFSPENTNVFYTEKIHLQIFFALKVALYLDYRYECLNHILGSQKKRKFYLYFLLPFYKVTI